LLLTKGDLELSIELVLAGGSDDRPSHVESLHLNFKQLVAPLHTSIWDDPLILLRPTKVISLKTINLLSNSKCNGQGYVSAFAHLSHFNITQQNIKIVQDNESCRLFVLTFEG
jgi:hypothetical protein